MHDEKASPRGEHDREAGFFYFGTFRFDSDGLVLYENRSAVRLGPKPLAVLKCLLERPGEVVSKQHLMHTVWNEISVTEDSLGKAINRLRHALADDLDDPVYIQTIHRRGYRFIAPVSVDGRVPGQEPPGERADRAPSSRSAGTDGLGHQFFSRRERPMAWGLAALLAALASMIAAATWRPPESPRGEGVRGTSAPSLPLADRAPTAKLFVGAVAPGNAVFRYDVGITGSPTLDLALTDPSFATPGWFAFSPAGEMFVVNISGVISRFLDPQGNPVFNGSIVGSFSNSHWATFRDDELFVADPGTGDGSVERFLFDDTGDAVANGEIDVVTGVIQVNPATGELFVPQRNPDRIERYLIDPSGNAVSNGSFTDVALNNPHDSVFSPWGELFVVNYSNNNISRFVFDALGNASANGLITGDSLSLPIGVDFSPWGELFVANRNDGVISRFVFDALFDATFNGSFRTLGGIHDLQFGPPTVRVDIDIKPGRDPNSINVGSNLKLPVGIYSSVDFDATRVDPLSVTLASGKVWLKGKGTPMSSFSDLDGDGLTDIVVQVATDSLLPVSTDTKLVLMGTTLDGIAFTGSDTIRVVRQD